MSLRGLIAAPFTPMKKDGSINLDIIPQYAELLKANGVSGGFVCGTTGEGMSMIMEERMQVAEEWSKADSSDFKVIVHIGSTSIEESRMLMSHADRIGASAVGMMGPGYLKPDSVDALVSYCKGVANAAPEMPFYYYHMPSITGIGFSMLSFLEKASDEIPNLAGIKYTFEDLMDFHLCQKFDNGRYDILFGRDEILLCSLVLGAKGAVGSTYNFAAPLYTRLISDFEAGDLESARTLQGDAMEVIKAIMSVSPTYLPAAKSLMKYFGVDCGPVRLPLTNINDMQYRSLVDNKILKKLLDSMKDYSCLEK